MKIKLIAEIGSVHDGSIGNAEKLIELASQLGADIVKFQMHIHESESLRNAPSPDYFKNESRYDYFKRISFNKDQWVHLYKVSKKKGLKFMVSPFSIKAVKILEKTGCDFYKVPSGEVTNHSLLKEILKTRKPIFLSSGMSNWNELDQAFNILKKGYELIIMQCTSLYPCPNHKVGLNIIKDMKERYNTKIGFSDHTSGISAAIAAVVYGATYIEKHLTFSKRMYGSDAINAIKPKKFKELSDNLKDINQMISKKIDKNNIKDFKKEMI